MTTTLAIKRPTLGTSLDGLVFVRGEGCAAIATATCDLRPWTAKRGPWNGM